MKIVIPDDYQDIADKLPCFALIRHHEVTRYTDAAHDLDTLAARFYGEPTKYWLLLDSNPETLNPFELLVAGTTLHVPKNRLVGR